MWRDTRRSWLRQVLRQVTALLSLGVRVRDGRSSVSQANSPLCIQLHRKAVNVVFN